MEYADGGTLQNYLKEHFGSLTWRDKFNLALQLAYTVSCLHDEGIAHRNLVIHLHVFNAYCIRNYDLTLSVIFNYSTPITY
jgi:serine/threonine protein kinase